MKAPKRKKLDSLLKGQPDHSNAEVLAQMAAEIWNANQNTLVAHWIKEHPGVPADEISLLQWSDAEGVHFKVVHKPIEAISYPGSDRLPISEEDYTKGKEFRWAGVRAEDMTHRELVCFLAQVEVGARMAYYSNESDPKETAQ